VVPDASDDADAARAEGSRAGASDAVATPEPRARRAPGSDESGANPADSGASATATGSPVMVEQVVVAAIRPSPFQPKGRPSIAAVEAVRKAIAEAGSLAALTSPEGAPIFARLGAEAARLAELAFDMAEHGMKLPIEIRVTEDGILECLSGHRRLAAAKLAGMRTVAAIHRGAISNAAAAATVLRGNLHRENFTTWQEAVLVSEVQQRRLADGYKDTVRTLGTVMGWSHGKVNMLLRIRRALGPEVVARIADEAVGGPEAVEERLAHAAYRDLERLAGEPDEQRRILAARRMLGVAGRPAESPRECLACVLRPKRGGGFALEVNGAVEALAAHDARALRDLLEGQLARVNARLQALSTN
jgi:ParB family chromosome partitioning protein